MNYFKVSNKIYDLNLTPYEIITYIYIIKCIQLNHNPTYSEISTKTKISIRKINDVIKQLISKQIIAKELLSNIKYIDNIDNIK